MLATRARLAAVLEWACAAAVIVAIVAVARLMLHELPAATVTSPVSADGPQPAATPAGVPERAVHVPLLLLPDGLAIRVGDLASSVLAALGPQADIGNASVEPTGTGERRTHIYDHAGVRFALVFERADATADLRVSAIYVR